MSETRNGHYRILAVLLGGLLLGGLAGCAQQQHEDLVQYMNAYKAKQQGRVDPLPEIQPYVTHHYGAEDLRDPFRPVVARAQAAPDDNGVRPDPNRTREVLEEVPLDALRFVGSVQRDDAHWAIVRAPDGRVHRVRRGNYIGQNDGRIHNITERSLHLTELVPTGTGSWLEREASLVLSE
ncbi:pilus assembly protein PilP [Ectothiorhodospiraceae bacterium 2226]|nr:pilus assembly protein PilP [Ectothiorhodospiraceae bacterium 2226]